MNAPDPFGGGCEGLTKASAKRIVTALTNAVVMRMKNGFEKLFIGVEFSFFGV